MTEEKKNEIAVWTPKEFDGNDLLPLSFMGGEIAVEGVPQDVGRDNVDPNDLILPALTLLQATSKAVQDKVEGANPGQFMHTGTEEVLPAGPIRVILAHYHKGNALFPKEDARYDGLETCIAPDGVEGSVYGLCEECGRCMWPENGGLPLNGASSPLGAETHHFVAFTDWGPCMLRFSRTSFRGGSKFLTTWRMSRKNLWAHPAVVRVSEGHKTLKSGKTTSFYHMAMTWQTTERVPDELQRLAYQLYQEVSAKHASGHLRSQDEREVDDSMFDAQ